MNVAMPTYNCPELAAQCVESILRGSVLPDAIIVVDNGGGFQHKDAIVFRPGRNLGCAASWNWILSNPAPTVITNDDENFWPTYDEDSDYCYRMKLAGVPIASVPQNDFVHLRHSSAAKDWEFLHGENARKREAYYAKKWGGPPGQEVYSVPFDVRKARLVVSP